MEDKKSFDAPEVKLHFLDYWRIIRIRKTVILAVFLLVAVTTTLVTFILPEKFASTVRISVEKDATDVAGIQQEKSYVGFDPYWIQTQFEKIQSKLILYQVISNLQLRTVWAKKLKEEGELPLELTFNMLKSSIDVNQSRNTSLIEIRVISEEKEEAPKIANEIADVYKKSRIDRWLELAGRGITSLEEEYQKQDDQVRTNQAVVDRMKETLGVAAEHETSSSGNSLTPESEMVRKLESLRIEVEQEFVQIDTVYGNLTNMTRAEFKRAIATVERDTQLMNLLDQLHAAEQKFAESSEVYAGEHPEVKRIRKVLDQINAQVEERLDGIMSGIKAKREATKAKLDLIEERVNTFREKEIAIAIARRPYIQAKRDLENKQFIRERLYGRIMQEKVDAQLPRTAIVEIIDKAEVENRAVRPKKGFNIALGIIMGLAIGIGLAFFIEYLDTSVKTIDDVERALQAPVLGVIPQNVGYLIFEGPDSPHAEAYRVLRTNILFSHKENKLNTITIVSAGAGEGKSTTIFNLATTFAQNNARVLIVDSDLRRPSLHKILKISNAIGLTNYLLRQNTLEEVIQTTPVPTLDFLPSGKLPSSAMGVLSSQQMKDLIQELKQRYDYVFFDSPPIMGVSDASILASEVDCVMQVIQYRRYPQPMTIRAKQMIEKVGGNLLGIVLNNINMASDENYYYYSGYYYDYYSKSEDAMEKPAGGQAGDAEDGKVEVKSKY